MELNGPMCPGLETGEVKLGEDLEVSRAAAWSSKEPEAMARLINVTSAAWAQRLDAGVEAATIAHKIEQKHAKAPEK
jgi:hypothetical protein